MWKQIALASMTVASLALVSSAVAHHGWGSYDAKNPVTVAGKVKTSKYENPHVVITVDAVAKPDAKGTADAKAPAKTEEVSKTWTITLAPTSRMINRGALVELVAVGKEVSAFGYPSTVEKDEIRAERITVDGKTIEMR